VPLVVAAAAVVVLGTAVGGGPRLTSPFDAGTGGPGPSDAAPSAPAPTTVPTPSPLEPGVSETVQTVLLVVALLIALVVAVLLIRLLIGAIRDRRRRPARQRLLPIDAQSAPDVADAPTVLRGIAAALAAFDEHREPGDAVVRAWLGLERAAEDAGFARAPAETPTEFTARVLTRTGADRVALRTLLRLYLRARFGDGAITAADATAAREALRVLEVSWERVTA